MSTLKRAGFAQGIYQTSEAKKESLGALRITQDGRKFRYARAGAAALGIGKAGQMLVATANHINRPLGVIVPVGARVISVTVGATAVTADQYADGYFQVNDVDGEGLCIPIVSNSAIGAAGGAVFITLANPLPIALAVASDVSLIPNPWAGVTESNTATNGFAGVAPVNVPIGHYYWAQTGGMANVLGGAVAGAVGTKATFSGVTAGALVGNHADGTGMGVNPIIGTFVATALVNTEYSPIWLVAD
jgi:hypothetical protein